MLTLLWEYHPLEVIVYGAITLFCGVALALCLIGLLSSNEEEDDVC